MKSQGSTLNQVVVNVKRHNGRKLSRELLYVGCSRAASYNGLYIDGDFEAPAAPPPNDAVTLEMARLRNAPLQICLRFLQDVDDTFEKLFFHNVESFVEHQHYLDVRADHCAMASNILAFVEPHLLQTDNLLHTLPNFKIIHRTNCRDKTQRNSEGALIFAKPHVAIRSSPQIVTDFKTKAHCIFVSFEISNVKIVIMYKSPKYPKTPFLEILKQHLDTTSGNCFFIGDININLQASEGKSILHLFRQYNLKSSLDIKLPSTDYATHIDCCFSNMSGLKSWFYESYYSYHKPICVIWPKMQL